MESRNLILVSMLLMAAFLLGGFNQFYRTSEADYRALDTTVEYQEGNLTVDEISVYSNASVKVAVNEYDEYNKSSSEQPQIVERNVSFRETPYKVVSVNYVWWNEDYLGCIMKNRKPDLETVNFQGENIERSNFLVKPLMKFNETMKVTGDIKADQRTIRASSEYEGFREEKKCRVKGNMTFPVSNKIHPSDIGVAAKDGSIYISSDSTGLFFWLEIYGKELF